MPHLLALREEGALESLLKHTRPLDTEMIINLTQRIADPPRALLEARLLDKDRAGRAAQA